MQCEKRYSKKEFISETTRYCAEEHRVCGATDMHWHDFYELELILSGSGCYQINQTAYPAEQGMVFFMSPTDFHMVTAEQNAPLHLVNVMFEGSCIDELVRLSFYPHPGRFVSLSGSVLQEFLGLCRLLTAKQACPDSFSASYGCHLLNALLILLLRASGRSLAEEPDQTPLLKAVQILETQFKEPLSLSHVARQAGLAQNYLSGKFHAYFGVTFKEYLIGLRLEYARKMLLYSHDTVTEICYDSGFRSFPHFLRSFKGSYGLSPGSYRKAYKNAARAAKNEQKPSRKL